jgi:CrcB protein
MMPSGGSLPGWLLVALGSALGGVARYGAMRLWPIVPGQWPTATMLVNLLGSFLIGVLSVLFALRSAAGAEPLRLFWMAGVLGGFTTYSAFALETVLLAGQGLAWRAGAYLLVTVFGCAVAALAGRALASMMILET